MIVSSLDLGWVGGAKVVEHSVLLSIYISVTAISLGNYIDWINVEVFFFINTRCFGSSVVMVLTPPPETRRPGRYAEMVELK